MDMVLDGGFADPVLQSQTVFRAVMDALANPGTVQNLVTPQSIGGSIQAELASVLLTLSDHDTSIWLDDRLRSDTAVLDFVNFHAGAPIVREPGRAAFAFATGDTHLPRLDQFNLGTQEYPDRSTTIVLAVEALDGGAALITRGPGIKGHGHISPVGLPGDFVAQWADNRELFPRGIDLLLVADGAVMGLPRSTRITEGH
ncbi:phosphonate C-P lyase system protein PhnH [Devosia sp. SL43]|uniref:phosphonate C-P lyase system protein PhnH n=1 Tax=Devosia sp. SL43 TaxID=2806348 RepID=UPI001F0C958B|nr:phosphonate C-P lyase system protein PhnH [Devosia sp. SL43]UJW85403.1 phosphonate C-P lyase system protein PhnH [Devosia sp. SL43]